MKTLEQLAREAGCIGQQPSVIMLDALARFRAACRAEALEEAAQRCDKIGAATWWPNEARDAADQLAAAIREMK